MQIDVQNEESEQEDTEDGSYIYERNYKGFYRSIPLPINSDPEKIEASYDKGILKLEIAKSEMQDESSKRIEVR